MKIIYIVSAMHYPNGMARVLTEKLNWLASHTNHELWMIETERADLPHYYQLDSRIQCVNFDLNFDSMYSLPFFKRLIAWYKREHAYMRLLSDFLMQQQADMVVSTLRREINFLHRIPDGSMKVGEMHFGRSHYRIFQKKYLPTFVNQWITALWQKQFLNRIKQLDRFIVLTHEDRESWPELPHVEVIPNFICHMPNEVSTCQEKRVIALGRYTDQKGFDLLFDAWAYVEHSHPDWRLDIYGSGNREYYQTLADKRGLKNVVCHDAVRDVSTIYTSASIYVLSSRYEGFGLVLIEAMAHGLPVVSFDCPCGPRDIISHGRTGLLVKNGDTTQLAQALLRIMRTSPEVRCRMGRWGHERVARHFMIDAVLGKSFFLNS